MFRDVSPDSRLHLFFPRHESSSVLQSYADTTSTSDYATNVLLDRYSDPDIDDDENVEEMTAAQQRAAEATMARRDR